MDYITLKTAIQEAERNHGIQDLDHVSREILHEITIAHHKGQHLRISDIARKLQYGTPPTIYARIKELVDGGWVERLENENDKRSMLLTITPKAKTVFRKISKALERAN